MTKELFKQAITKFLLGLVTMGLLLFLPAGTLHWGDAWLLIALLFVPMFLAGLVLMARSPELLRKRLNAREREMEQKKVIALSGLMFLAAFVTAGLNFRFGWIVMPRWTVWAAASVFLLAYALYAEVLPDRRGAGGAEGRRHRALRRCAAPDVRSDPAAVSLHAAGARLAPLLPHSALLHPAHRHAHPRRGGGPCAGSRGLHGLYAARTLAADSGSLVRRRPGGARSLSAAGTFRIS